MARDLDGRIYTWVLKLLRYLKTVPRSLPNDVIVRQVLRSGTSIGANYIEAQGASSRKDFSNFVQHSFKSARESAYWLQLLSDSYADAEHAKELRLELSELIKILGAILVKTKAKK